MAGPFVFEIAKGRLARYADLTGGANDAICWMLLKSSGLEADATLKTYTTLSALLAATNDEATFTGYTANGIVHTTSIVPAVVGGNVKVDDQTDPSWNPTTAEALGAIIAYYDPDSTSHVAANCVPLFKDDFVLTTPTAGSITYQVASGGFYTAS